MYKIAILRMLSSYFVSMKY